MCEMGVPLASGADFGRMTGNSEATELLPVCRRFAGNAPNVKPNARSSGIADVTIRIGFTCSADDNLYQSSPEDHEFRMMRFCFGNVAKVRRTSSVLRASLCLAVALLVGCAGPKETPAIKTVNLSLSGLTVTKVRAANNAIILLEQRLTSIFEDGPQRTLAILQSDGQPIQSYMPPAGWSIVDFAVHPSGDISAILTTAREVRIVRLDSNGSIRSDQPFLDPAAAIDPYFDYAGGIKDDDALQPALMHDAARLAPLGESLAVVLRTGRNAIVAYRLDPDVSGAYQRAWRTLIEPGSSIFFLGITSGSFDVFGQLENHLSIFVDIDTDATLAIGVVDAPICSTSRSGRTQNISANRLQHRSVSYSRVWRAPTAAVWEALPSTLMIVLNCMGCVQCRAASCWWAEFSPRCDQTERVGMRSLHLLAAMALPVRTAWSMLTEVTCFLMLLRCPAGDIWRWVPPGTYRTHPARVSPKLRSHCWRC